MLICLDGINPQKSKYTKLFDIFYTAQTIISNCFVIVKYMLRTFRICFPRMLVRVCMYKYV